MLSSRHAPLAVGALALALALGAAWPFTVDDAFIAARYAARLAAGQGYTFSGSHASDGVTGPLWLLPLVAGARLGATPIVLAKLLSGLAGVLATVWLAWRVQRASRGLFVSWVVVLGSASSLPLLAWSIAGLETGLATLCVSWLAIASWDRRPLQTGVALAALAWLRPELAFFGAALWAALWWRERAAAWTALAWAGTGVALLLAFRQLMFEHLLPMTAYAKPAQLEHGARYLLNGLNPRGLAVASALVIALLARGGRGRGWGLASIAHGLAVLLAGGDWMPARRLFVPIVPVVFAVIGLGLRRSLLRRPGWTCAGCALLVALGARECWAELPALRSAGARRDAALPAIAGEICTEEGPVAVIDVGLIGSTCARTDIIDLAGLTEPAIAYARGGHLDKVVPEAWLQARKPARLVLHTREPPRVDAQRNLRWFAGYPSERRVLGFGFVRGYRVRTVIAYAPSYYYVVLTPEQPAR